MHEVVEEITSSKPEAHSLISSTVDRHCSTILNRWEFSSAAATRSLSFNCLFTWSSDACPPSVICTRACRHMTSKEQDGLEHTTWQVCSHIPPAHTAGVSHSWSKSQRTEMSILYVAGSLRMSCVRIHKPMSVARLQWSIVGVNCTLHETNCKHYRLHVRFSTWVDSC